MPTLVKVSCQCGIPTEIPSYNLTIIKIVDLNSQVTIYGYAHHCMICGKRTCMFKNVVSFDHPQDLTWLDLCEEAGAEQITLIRPTPHQFQFEPLTQQEVEDWIADLPGLDLHRYFGIPMITGEEA